MGTGTLWFALLGGPVAWTAHLLGSYPLVPLACDHQTTLPLNLLTLLTAVVAAAAAAAGGVSLRRIRSPAAADEEWGDRPTLDRARFMAASGLLLGLFFLYVIAVEGLPPLLHDPCFRDF